MNARFDAGARRGSVLATTVFLLFGASGCGTSSGVSSSVQVGYGSYYGPGYYGPGYYGGYYDPYPPVIIVPPDRPERPDPPDRPTTLPSYGGKPAASPGMTPSRPPSSSRPTTRPSPRPAPRPMPRGGGMRR